MKKKNFLKKTLAISLAAMFILGSAPLAGLCGFELPSLFASAADETNYMYTEKDNQITVTGHNNPVGKLTIPETINGMPVTKIAYGAFSDCEMITSVSIPATVSLIDLHAFNGCKSLSSVTFEKRTEDQLLKIDNWAFMDCSALSSINLEDSNVVTMGGGVFKDCTTLAKIVMPDTLINVDGGTFYGCTNLSDVTLSKNMTVLYSFGPQILGFFYGCENLTEITIPANITTIGTEAFKNSGIKKINFEENCKLTTISSQAFCGSNLESINIPATVALIEANAFADCKKLTSVTFEKRAEDQLLEIQSLAFSGCKLLSSINLEDSNVITMGGGVFRNCSALTKVVMPDTLINVDGGIFYGCTNLSDVTLSKNMTALYCFGARMEGFFYECENLTEITIPAKITIIDYDAFCNSGLEKINFEENSKLTAIAAQSFIGTKLQSIRIPASVSSIERIAFQNTKELKYIVFEGNENLEIANYAFYKCDKLTDVYYSGSEEEWNNNVIINETGNEALLNATMHFNSNGPETEISIVNNSGKTSFETGENISLSANIKFADGDMKIAWYVDGAKAGEGADFSFTADKAGKIEVKAACIDESGNILTSDYVTLTVAEKPVVEEPEVTVPAPAVTIRNNNGTKTINYGETLKLTAVVKDMPSDAKIYWYVNGEKAGEGTTFEVSPESGTVKVTVKIVDENGADYAGTEISDSQNVSVNSGFLQKIIAFFMKLFGISRTVTQAFFVK